MKTDIVHQCQCVSCLIGLEHPEKQRHHQLNLLLSRLDEQQRRWVVALESKRFGHGGDTLFSLITGLHVDTIRRGREELDADLVEQPPDRIRQLGAGRPLLKKKDPQMVADLRKLAEPITGGNPMTQSKYVRRSLKYLSNQLAALGHGGCPNTVADLLRALDYRPRVNVKRFTGPRHPDRDRQFAQIESWIAFFREHGWPILSVDAKKKELVGNFANGGATWLQEAYQVNAHDFLSDALARVTPYGLYDLLANHGHVVVSTSANTPWFAATAVAWWWVRFGCHRYRGCGALLILADGGSSNGCRPRMWKKGLQVLVADRHGLVVVVCHYPTGASKWNPIEHRLFGPISTNWAGEPLRTPEIMLRFLLGTSTETGLYVTADWWEREFPRGMKVSDKEMAELLLEPHTVIPRWNYSIFPQGME